MDILRIIFKKSLFFISFFIFIIIRLISFFKLIRFGQLYSSRIGHFAANTELYLCKRDHNRLEKKTIDIFYYNKDSVCNYQLLKMWGRVLYINNIALKLNSINKEYFKKEKHEIKTINSDRDINGLYELSDIHLYFTQQEKNVALNILDNMGIYDNKYICLIGRDTAYLSNKNKEKDWSYHNYRNVDIDNYKLVAEELASRGYHVLRMGDIVEKPFKYNNPLIHDYSNGLYRSDLMDIYLSGNCYFFISCGTGLDAIPSIFRLPVLYVNLVPVEYLISWNSKSIIIFKKYWLKKEERYMTFKEIIETGAGRFLRTEDFVKNGIELVENTSEEIRDVAIEMDERLKGTWKTTQKDEELQKKFWDLIPKTDLNKVIRSHIGASFLRNFHYLLD